MSQSMFLWAYATLETRVGHACVKALAAQAQKQLPRFQAQQMANMLWAFSKLQFMPNAALLRSCEAHAMRVCEALTPSGLVRCCASSTVASNVQCLARGHIHPPALPYAAHVQIPCAQTQHKPGVTSADRFNLLRNKIVFVVVQAMLLRAYSMLGAPMGSHCLAALAAHAQEQLLHFDAKSMANMLSAFARLKYKPDAALLRSCEAHATCNVAAFAPQELVCCCFTSKWTWAVLAHGTAARVFVLPSVTRKVYRA